MSQAAQIRACLGVALCPCRPSACRPPASRLRYAGGGAHTSAICGDPPTPLSALVILPIFLSPLFCFCLRRLTTRRRSGAEAAAQVTTAAAQPQGSSSPVRRVEPTEAGYLQEQELVLAAERGDLVALERLLCQGVDVDARDEVGLID